MASSPAQPTAALQQPTIAFVLRPQPVTLWFQFDDGSQLGVSPSPERIATSIFGMPMMGGMPILMVPGLFGGAGGSGNFERQLHELFLRTQNEQHGPPPTSKDFLDKIPLKTWNEKMKQAEKHVECSICLCDYEENDQVLPLPCGHQFHKECGMKWLLEHNVCPTCRYALPTQDATVPTPETAANAVPASRPVTTVSPAEPAPSPEPEAEEHVAHTPSRVRQRSPRHTPQRVVRRRISEMESVVLPSHSTEDDAMDNLLEEEASRFIAEEQEKQRIAHVTFDDRDVEDLMHDTSV